MNKFTRLTIIILLSFIQVGCVTQMAVGAASTAISVPFQVAGQVADKVTDPDE